jgi:hypothetical protein
MCLWPFGRHGVADLDQHGPQHQDAEAFMDHVDIEDHFLAGELDDETQRACREHRGRIVPMEKAAGRGITLGLGFRLEDFTRVLLQPKAFAVGAFNQLLVVSASALLLATLFCLPTGLAVGLMILPACPGGVLSNSATKVAGGYVPLLSISLTAIMSLISTITLPLVVTASVSYLRGGDAPPIDVKAFGLRVFILTTAPVALGVLVTRYFPNFVAARSAAISHLAFWLFLAVIVAAVIANWQSFVDHTRPPSPSKRAPRTVPSALPSAS